MKFAVVVGNIPNPTSGGGALTAWSVVKSLVEFGHTVTVCIIENLHLSPSKRMAGAQLTELSTLGVKTVSVKAQGPSLSKPKRRSGKPTDIFAHCLEDYYPTARLTSSLRVILERESAEGVFVYHFEPLAAAYRLESLPVLAAVGDPTHLPGYYRWRSEPFRLNKEYLRLSAATALTMIRIPSYMREMMSHCAGSGAFAAHHAAWFRRIGVSHCQYFRTPVVDEVGSDWLKERQSFANKPKFKLLLIGHLKGTATLSGMYLFAREVLPLLERELGPDNFEVHIVGGYAPPDHLRGLLNRPSVKMRGQIEPATEEFLSSDVVIVPTPIKLGIRVRIITGFSFGCCIVSHQSNALGIPEMVDGENALLPRNGKEMASAILEALANSSLRKKLETNARQTYEEYFTPKVAGGRICAELERIAIGRGAHAHLEEIEGLTPRLLS